MNRIGMIALLAFVCPRLNSSDDAPTVPAQMLVSVGHYFSREPPTLTRSDLIVTERNEPLPVTQLIRLRGDRAGLRLFLLIDNCSNWERRSQFEELQHFILSQPSTTMIGVAHVQNARLQVAQNPTPDRERAVKALNTSVGCQPSSPFIALAKLIRDWPQGPLRRAVLLISNGIDPAAADEMLIPSAEAAIEASQRAEVTVYAIYHPAADYRATGTSRLYAGQVQLAHVAIETGGEAYFKGLAPLPSLSPFLADIAEHLANQYLLEFFANPATGFGALQEVTVQSRKIPQVELMAPYRVWVPGHRPGRSTDNELNYVVSCEKRSPIHL